MSDRFLDDDQYQYQPPCFCDTPAGQEFCPMHGTPEKPFPDPPADLDLGPA